MGIYAAFFDESDETSNLYIITTFQIIYFTFSAPEVDFVNQK